MTKPRSPKRPVSPPERSGINHLHTRSLKSPPERNNVVDSSSHHLRVVAPDYRQHRDVYGDGAAVSPDCWVDDGRYGGEREGRRREGTGWDLRMKLNHKAHVQERERQSDQRSGVRERASRKRGGLLFIVLLTLCGVCVHLFFQKSVTLSQPH